MTDAEILDALKNELGMLSVRIATANNYLPHQFEALSEFAMHCNKLLSKRELKSAS